MGDNSQKYIYGFTSVMAAIVNKAAVARDFGDEGLSTGGRGGWKRETPSSQRGRRSFHPWKHG